MSKNEIKQPYWDGVLNKQTQNASLFFTRTRRATDRLAQQVTELGIDATALHGEKKQSQREERIADFRSGEVSLLIATDLAARGLHIEEIDLIINYDLPAEPETFVHRIGRTGRIGMQGQAIHFCDPTEKVYLETIETQLNLSLPYEKEQPYHSEQIRHFSGKKETKKDRVNPKINPQSLPAGNSHLHKRNPYIILHLPPKKRREKILRKNSF